jgi:hypothetical protein
MEVACFLQYPADGELNATRALLCKQEPPQTLLEGEGEIVGEFVVVV